MLEEIGRTTIVRLVVVVLVMLDMVVPVVLRHGLAVGAVAAAVLPLDQMVSALTEEIATGLIVRMIMAENQAFLREILQAMVV